MADERPDRNYDVRDLNRVFAIGSLVLLVVTLLMVADDYSRQWKDVQRRFHSQEASRTRREIQEAERALQSGEMKRLQGEMKTAETELGRHRDAYDKATKKLSKIEADLYGKDLDFRFAKATFDSKKYETEQEIAELRKEKKDKEAEAKQAELDAVQKKMDVAKLALEKVTTEQTAAKAEVAALAGKIDELQTRMTKVQATRDRLKKRLETVDSSFATWLVNAPMLDFMAPTLQIQQVVLPKLRHDINFMEIPRVDRCQTCHTVIDKPGYDKPTDRQPFRTHPNLSVYVEQSSKHPIDRFGCTACHGGRDRGTSFANTAHTPDNPKQQKEWEERYGWEKMKYWDTPMRSRTHFYAGCYQCHNQQVNIPEAGPLNHGVRIVEVSGCYGCHAIKGFEKMRKAGPDLSHIASKTDEKWAFRWIRNPRSFRTGARMPTFFGQDNQKDLPKGDRPAASDLNDAEIEAIITYVWDKATPIKYDPVSGGNPAKGKELFDSIGCRACHTDDAGEKFANRSYPRAFGPNLAGLGSKTSQAWVFRWLKDPKHYWKETNMPNLRLSDQEALDLSAYLAGKRNESFEKIPLPTVSDKTRDWLTREYLSARLSQAETDAKMRTMDVRAKKLYLGEKMINKYGCFGCHLIKGFENTQPIGTELTEEGSKPVERLDFGLKEDVIPHNLPAWVSAKLENPRQFDEGKIKTWDEKLKMPNFYFTPEENAQIVTVIQALSKARMDVDMRRTLSADEAFIEEGRRVVRDHNCIGCHTFERDKAKTTALGEAAIRSTIQDVGYWPPMLAGEGEKVIPLWLFNFVKSPSTIRPWLTVRMPTFGLNDHDTVAISRMFAHADKAEYPFESDYFKLEPAAPEITTGGAKLFTEFKCLQCHVAGAGKPERDAADLAPNLSLARARLRPLWIEKWLKNPEALQPGTRMPGFFPDMKSPDKETLGGDAATQIRALRYHVLGLAGKGVPAVSTGN